MRFDEYCHSRAEGGMKHLSLCTAARSPPIGEWCGTSIYTSLSHSAWWNTFISSWSLMTVIALLFKVRIKLLHIIYTPSLPIWLNGFILWPKFTNHFSKLLLETIYPWVPTVIKSIQDIHSWYLFLNLEQGNVETRHFFLHEGKQIFIMMF